jgi:hypothetical protein
LGIKYARELLGIKATEAAKNSSYGARSAKRKASGSGNSPKQKAVSSSPSQYWVETCEARPPLSKKRYSIHAKAERVLTEIPTITVNALSRLSNCKVTTLQRLINRDSLSSAHPTLLPPKSIILVCPIYCKGVKNNSEPGIIRRNHVLPSGSSYPHLTVAQYARSAGALFSRALPASIDLSPSPIASLPSRTPLSTRGQESL